jgi:hypothetical protein
MSVDKYYLLLLLLLVAVAAETKEFSYSSPQQPVIAGWNKHVAKVRNKKI